MMMMMIVGWLTDRQTDRQREKEVDAVSMWAMMSMFV